MNCKPKHADSISASCPGFSKELWLSFVIANMLGLRWFEFVTFGGRIKARMTKQGGRSELRVN